MSLTIGYKEQLRFTEWEAPLSLTAVTRAAGGNSKTHLDVPQALQVPPTWSWTASWTSGLLFIKHQLCAWVLSLNLPPSPPTPSPMKYKSPSSHFTSAKWVQRGYVTPWIYANTGLCDTLEFTPTWGYMTPLNLCQHQVGAVNPGCEILKSGDCLLSFWHFLPVKLKNKQTNKKPGACIPYFPF